MTDCLRVPLFILAAVLVCLNACGASTPPPVNLNAPLATNAAASVVAATNPPQTSTSSNQNSANTASSPTAQPPAATQSAGPISSPGGASAPTDYFGANSNGEIIYNEQARALATVAGVQMVRTSVSWNAIEENKGKYRWDYFDQESKTLLDNHFVPLLMIMHNPKWAANSDCGPVNDLPAFEQFIRTLAQRYPQVQYWALYNEPDNQGAPDNPGAQCFGGNDLNGNGKPDVEDYAEQLHIAWRAIHQANPNAQLVSGALAFDNFNEQTAPRGYPGGGKGGSFNYNFPQQLFQYMAAHPLPAGEKYLDILSFNFYFIYGPYWEQQAGGISISAKANMLTKLMKDAGIQLPLL
ncbi:MAG TPA: hypothetical protein VFD70_02045, partial [Anaerolineae bacterium]|nr:hypothetical protein [Anaerolineae bacterium]